MTVPSASPHDDVPTIIAIAVLAFIAADIAHEVIGHGAAYLAVGGRSFIMTTTLSAAGLLFVPRLPQRSPLPPEPVTRSLGWILAALLAAVAFVGALGPGIPMSL